MFNRKQQNGEFKKHVSELIEDIHYQTSIDLSKSNKLGVIIDASSPVNFLTSVQSAFERLPIIQPNAGKDASNEDLEKVSTANKYKFAERAAKKAKHAADNDAVNNADVSVIRHALGKAVQPMFAILQAKEDIKKRLNDLNQSPADAGKIAGVVNLLNEASSVNPEKFWGSLLKMVDTIDSKIDPNMKIEDRLFYKDISTILVQVHDELAAPMQTSGNSLTK
jgi:hypothetical protein